MSEVQIDYPLYQRHAFDGLPNP